MKKLLSMIVFLSIVLLYHPFIHATTLEINAPAYILMDTKTGQILYEKNSNQRMFPASTTKIMTAILALENSQMNQIMSATASNVDPGRGGASVGIEVGEFMSTEDLLHALLIKSANETANILAENICPTRQDFVDKMNQKALEIGCMDTHFANTHGLHDPNHYTTAEDMAKIALTALKFPKFREIVAKTSYILHGTNKHLKWDPIINTNKLLTRFDKDYKSPFITKITGIKTGYTWQAGHNLVSMAENSDGMELMAVVFGVQPIKISENVYSCSKKLLEYGFINYTTQVLVTPNKVLKTVPVLNSKNNQTVDFITESKLSSVLPNDPTKHNLEEKIYYFSEAVEAPLQKGQIVGTVEYSRNRISLGKVNIITSQAVEKSFTAKTVDHVKNVTSHSVLFKIILTLFIAVLLLFSLRFVLRKVSKKVKYKRRK